MTAQQDRDTGPHPWMPATDNVGLMRDWLVTVALIGEPTERDRDQLRRAGWTVYQDRAERRCRARSRGDAGRAAPTTVPLTLRGLIGHVTAVEAAGLP